MEERQAQLWPPPPAICDSLTESFHLRFPWVCLPVPGRRRRRSVADAVSLPTDELDSSTLAAAVDGTSESDRRASDFHVFIAFRSDDCVLQTHFARLFLSTIKCIASLPDSIDPRVVVVKVGGGSEDVMHLAVANSYLNVLCFGEAASQFASSECPRWDPEARRVDVRSIEQCLLAVDTQPVAFVLIDTSDEGYELVRRLRRRAQLGAMPIVFFSPKPLADGEKVRGHSIGATEIVDGVASREIFLIKARYFVSVFREVGRMKERAALQAERLERSNRELEHFASTASHDLQEPLRTVTTYLALLERKYARRFDAEAEALIGSALQGAKRMSSLIDDLLRYTKLSRKEPRQETFDAASPLEEAIDNLHSAIEESGAKIHCDGKLPELIGDRSRIRQLFQNLLSNAIKFRGTEKPVIRFGCRRLNADWCFTVTDNGIGFDMKDSDRVFRIFERLQDRREYPGNGMGLPMCQQIVEQHGGRIWAKSRPGEGATFFFTLRASGAVAREESTASTAGGEAGIDPRR